MSRTPGAATVRAVVLADGDVPARDELDASWPGWDANLAFVVAADGGARLAGPLGLRIDRWVGDGDSIDPALAAELERAGVPMRRVPTAKDESDTELAVMAAVEAGAADLTILGALGGRRFDHALANVMLLAHPVLAGRPARLLDARARVTLLVGPAQAELLGRLGDGVSLLPLGDAVTGVVTTGLRYPLRREPLPPGRPRGLSNIRTAAVATVAIESGRLLLIETPATLRP